MLTELTNLQLTIERANRRADEHDFHNNSWMAGHALNDVHHYLPRHEQLRVETKVLFEQLPAAQQQFLLKREKERLTRGF